MGLTNGITNLFISKATTFCIALGSPESQAHISNFNHFEQKFLLTATIVCSYSYFAMALASSVAMLGDVIFQL